MHDLEPVCTGEEAIMRLKAGNKRYLQGEAPVYSTEETRRALAKNGQRPYACIVTCSDSRVVPEMIFAAALGELFVIRTAGNTISDSEMATIAYAGAHLGVPLVVVMGHTHCGAVEAALADSDDEDVKHIVEGIKGTIGQEKDPRRCEIINAQVWAKRIAESTVFAPHILHGAKEVAMAIYDVETGKVTFDDEIQL